MGLPVHQSQIRELQAMQSTWKTKIDPVIDAAQSNGQILNSVRLEVGSNTISHGLNRKLIGWMLTRKRAAAEIYDLQDNNNTPDINLILNSDAAVSVDIWVF